MVPFSEDVLVQKNNNEHLGCILVLYDVAHPVIHAGNQRIAWFGCELWLGKIMIINYVSLDDKTPSSGFCVPTLVVCFCSQWSFWPLLVVFNRSKKVTPIVLVFHWMRGCYGMPLNCARSRFFLCLLALLVGLLLEVLFLCDLLTKNQPRVVLVNIKLLALCHWMG